MSDQGYSISLAQMNRFTAVEVTEACDETTQMNRRR